MSVDILPIFSLSYIYDSKKNRSISYDGVNQNVYCGQTIPFYRKCPLANLTDYDYKINKERRRFRTDLIKPIKDKVIAFDSYSILNLLKIKVHSYLKQKSFSIGIC